MRREGNWKDVDPVVSRSIIFNGKLTYTDRFLNSH